MVSPIAIDDDIVSGQRVSEEEESKKKGRVLPKDFAPKDYHVIIGRGRKITSHKGNVQLRALVQTKLPAYQDGDKTTKSFILMEVVHRVEKLCPEGFGFVKFDTTSKRWYVVPRTIARMNVAQAFRDFLSPSYRSSKHSKRDRRLQEKGYIKGGPTEGGNGRDMLVDPKPISIVSALGSQQRKAALEYTSNNYGFTAKQTLQQLRGDGVLSSTSTFAAPYNIRGSQGLAHCIDQAFESMDEALGEQPLSISCDDSQEQQYRAPPNTAPSAQELLLEPLPPEDEEENDVDEELKFYQQTQQQQPPIQHQSYTAPPMRMNINMNLNLNMMRPGNTNANVVPGFLAQQQQQQQQQQGNNAFTASEQTSAFFLQGMEGAKASNYSCPYNNGYSFGNNNNRIINSNMPYNYASM